MENATKEHSKAMRRAAWENKVAAMREGRVQKAHTFGAKKGKGAYTRRDKHGKGWE